MSQTTQRIEAELSAWGRWEFRQSLHAAGKVKSSYHTIAEIGRLGIHSRGSAYLFDGSDSIQIPPFLEKINAAIGRLDAPSVRLIRAVYVYTPDKKEPPAVKRRLIEKNAGVPYQAIHRAKDKIIRRLSILLAVD